MSNILEYKGYHTKVEFDAQGKLFRGKIEGIGDYVDFECENSKNIEVEFHQAVDDYLDFCKEVGKKPEKEYKGTFNVRISPELHKKISFEAIRRGLPLNAIVAQALDEHTKRAAVKYRLKNIAKNHLAATPNSFKHKKFSNNIRPES